MIPTSTLGSPNTLLDYAVNKLGLKNDAALARRLRVSPPSISKVRHCKLPVGPALLISIHEETGDHIRDLKRLAGVTT